VGLVPLSEWRGIDLDDGGAGQGIGADKLVVGWVVDDTNDTGPLGNALGAPAEVASLETESAELAVAAAGADKVDTLCANTGVGRLAALLESSLLAVVCPLCTGSRALVARVTRDTVSS